MKHLVAGDLNEHPFFFFFWWGGGAWDLYLYRGACQYHSIFLEKGTVRYNSLIYHHLQCQSFNSERMFTGKNVLGDVLVETGKVKGQKLLCGTFTHLLLWLVGSSSLWSHDQSSRHVSSHRPANPEIAGTLGTLVEPNGERSANNHDALVCCTRWQCKLSMFLSAVWSNMAG